MISQMEVIDQRIRTPKPREGVKSMGRGRRNRLLLGIFLGLLWSCLLGLGGGLGLGSLGLLGGVFLGIFLGLGLGRLLGSLLVILLGGSLM